MGGRPPIPVTREQGWGGFWDPPGTESRCTLGREGALQAQKEHPGAPPNLDGEAATPTPRLPPGQTPALTKERNHVPVWEACLPLNE